MTSTHPSRLPDDWQLIHTPRSDHGPDACTLWPYGAILQGLPEDAARAIDRLPSLLAAPDLQAALTWLLDDLTDAGEDRNPQTGDEYDSVAFARSALARSKSGGIIPVPAVSRLLAACRMVVERWERGDLAEAARACSAAVAEAEAADIREEPPAASDPAKKPFSVLLMWPRYLTDGYDATFYARVEARDSVEAVALARGQALSANKWGEADPADFAPLLVIEGHHHEQPMTNNHHQSERN